VTICPVLLGAGDDPAVSDADAVETLVLELGEDAPR
jgi:hypothetical protein